MLDTNIRECHKKQNLIIKDLAERTGLSIGYISQVERERMEPSLSSLRKTAREFDVPLYASMDDHKGGHNLTIRREEHLSVRIKKSSVGYEFLTPLPSQNFSPKTLMIKATLEPGSRDSEIPIACRSGETLLILEGMLTVLMGDKPIMPHQGDTTIIEEDLPHTCINEAEDYVEVLSTVTPPMWGTLRFPGQHYTSREDEMQKLLGFHKNTQELLDILDIDFMSSR